MAFLMALKKISSDELQVTASDIAFEDLFREI